MNKKFSYAAITFSLVLGITLAHAQNSNVLHGNVKGQTSSDPMNVGLKKTIDNRGPMKMKVNRLNSDGGKHITQALKKDPDLEPLPSCRPLPAC